jgi:hypothetical protein
VVSEIRNDPRLFGGIQLVVCRLFAALSHCAKKMGSRANDDCMPRQGPYKRQSDGYVVFELRLLISITDMEGSQFQSG